MITDEEDLNLSEEDFEKIVNSMVETYSRLRWLWLGAPGTNISID